jgi:ubiquinone/menaquinone biosynthesis C-methylase UbiE
MIRPEYEVGALDRCMVRAVQSRQGNEGEVTMGIAVEQLHQQLDIIAKIPNEQWFEKLDERKRKELEFHDMHRDRTVKHDSDTYEKLYGNRKYYTTTQRSTEYIAQWVQKNAPGKVFLDYACGDGHSAIAAAKAGASLAIGIDISPVSIGNATARAREGGLGERCRFVQADAENTQLPDNSVDVVMCNGMLHHLDLSYAFPELRRIMAPGAVLLAVEALDYNPAIKLYRKLTPAMRTEWEAAHILSLKDLRFARRFFEIGAVNYWHIFSPLSAKFRKLNPLFDGLDAVLTKIPLAKLMAWIFTFELRKKAD